MNEYLTSTSTTPLALLALIAPLSLSFSISPGITFEDEDPQANFAFHFETSYEFEVRGLHMGPVLEFAFDPEDIHISLGLHIGFGFWV